MSDFVDEVAGGEEGSSLFNDDEQLRVLVEGRDEIPVDGPSGPSEAELKGQLEQLQQQLEVFKAQGASGDAMKSGFDQLAQAFREAQGNRDNGQQQQQPLEDYATIRKKLADTYWDDPIGAVEKLLKHVVQSEIAPAYQQTQQLLMKTSLETSRYAAQSDPNNKVVIEKWPGEVEQALKLVPAGPDAYEKACKMVAFQHLDDLVALRVQATQGSGGQQASVPARQVSNAQPMGLGRGGGGQAPSEGRVKTVVLTREQQEIARRRGMSEQDAAQFFAQR